ncbi:MAG: fructose-bisphosphate aldolase [Lactobacillaceae bacterium]|jgi:fructose-bisphosphate aldolase class II|nr:fructose-bisphosphate aldolase [Lactobacillaceae bacterium]
MTIVSGKTIIQNARDNGYAIGAFNTNNLEWTQAILRAAQAKDAPILITASMGAVKYMGGAKTVADLVRNLDHGLNITVPVAIHLDHGDYEMTKEAIAAGFTSVMFDGSDLSIAENLEKTREIVELAHSRGISVEAEVGSIGGEEDGIVGAGEIASIDESKYMVSAGVDFLAAGIGNMHGVYPADWQGLKLSHLKELGAAVDALKGGKMPIVLHGGSGVPDEQIREAISYGVAKVNVNTEAQLAFHQAVRDYVLSDEDLKGKNYDPRKFLKPGVMAIQKAVEDRIDVFGSAGKA